jgi:NAD(P)-dependent dehydrogenase (short-subunit alcohol dehydrogenase family)
MAAALRSLAGRSFLVTGGASGLGAATVTALAAKGAHVTILDMNADLATSLVSSLGGDAKGIQFCKTDVTSQESVQEAIAAATAKFGGVYGAVNCAGICPAVKVLGKKGVHPLDTFAKTISVNLIGTFNVARLAAEAMSKSAADESGERGCIINTASIAAYEGQIGQAAYAASKGGVVGLTLPLSRELAANGIRVNAIAPGVMWTPLLAGLPKPAQDALGAAVPFPKRLGTPAEFAALAEHIFSNQYINGTVIRMDGSLRMQ